MPLPPGTRIGVYEITGQLGAGGMGEVYRARDCDLERQVAIKVLPEALAADRERIARFEREARTLAAVNHSHIAAVYGLEKVGGVPALVMELVEGPTLADRLVEGPIPVDEALRLSKEIADALDAAHEKAIVHRDLKPANIKITTEGNIKVLDFGLAKALAGDTSTAALTQSPTLTLQATGTGVILGTASYMSPEQARGRVVDKRTDIFSFGAVVYEMLSGRQAFPGDSVTEILARVIEREPDWTALPPALDPRVVDLLRRCLEKDPGKRRRDMGDIEHDLDVVLASPPSLGAPSRESMRRSRIPWTVAGVALVIAVVTVVASTALLVRAPADPPEMQLDVATPATPSPTSFAVSPDGQRLAYVAFDEGLSRLWVRPLNAAAAQVLRGTEGATFPFWSPDNRGLGFFANGKLKRVDLSGGSPQTIADAPNGRGGAWGDGVILFATTGSPLRRVPASGGSVSFATKLEGSALNHRLPQFLADGHRFLFRVGGDTTSAGIYLGSIDTSNVTRLLSTDVPSVMVPSGWLVYVQQGRLLARTIDVEHAALSGEPIVVATPAEGANIGAVSASATGLIAYRTTERSRRQLVWVDRAGRHLGAVAAADTSDFSHPKLSPDGRRIAVERTLQSNVDVWVLDGSRAVRLTFEPGLDHGPVWSPDGRQIAFDSDRLKMAGHQFFWKPSSGAGADAELLAAIVGDKGLNDWSPDGRFILYAGQQPDSLYDLFVLPLEGERKPRAFVRTPFTEQQGQFSPDGRWIAYQSNASGQFEIYVRPFPGPGGQWQVTSGGGTSPRWRHDGKELYFISPSGELMAAAVAATGDTFAADPPVTLFQPHIVGGGTADIHAEYDVASDGRFLINTVVDETVPPINLVLNWKGHER